MEATNRVLGGAEASLAIAGVTLRRLLRGRALWVVLLMSALPPLYALTQDVTDLQDFGVVLASWALLLGILPPVLLASAIGEEVEERTMSYLWSRPLPRWSIVIGKMVALVPILWLALGAALLVPFYTSVPGAAEETTVAAQLVAMVVLATCGAAAVTAGLTTILPRHGTIVSIAYLLFVDEPLAAIDASISRLSVVYNAIHLSGVAEEGASFGTSLAWLLGLIAVWVGIAVWRIRSLE